MAGGSGGSGISGISLWRHEARRVGGPALFTPVFTALVLVAAAEGLHRDGFLKQLLVTSAPALVIGMTAATVAGGERAYELLLTTPTPIRNTVWRRMALLGFSAAVGVLAMAAGLELTGAGPPSALDLLLISAFSALLTATGVWAALALRSAAGAATVVLAVWLAKLFVLDRWAPGPATQALLVAVLTGLPLARAGRLLADGARLLEGGR
ncbi:hypothetical protein [Actinokineospora iranica]|nr:hypothetical protein [Actinokineospora iranica]